MPDRRTDIAAQDRREALLAIARPWLALREQWQAILDAAAPASAMSRRAPEVLDYIDEQLGRLSGPAI